MSAIKETVVRAQRSWVTRSLSRAVNLLKTPEPAKKTLVETRENLAQAWSKYSDLFAKYQTQELEAERTDSLKAEESEFNTQDPQVADALMKLDTLIEKGQKQTGDTPVANSSSPQAPVKPVMPQIKIPDFYGDTDQWETYWDTFRSLVHDRTDIDDVLKFTYLRHSLHGPAAKAIEGFRTTSKDYQLAIHTLEEDFANKEKVKRVIIDRLLDLEPPRNTVEDLINFKSEFRSAMRMLEQHADVKETEFLLQQVIQRRLPTEVEQFIMQRENTQYLGVKQISEGLQFYIEMMKRSQEKDSKMNRVKESQSKQQASKPASRPPVGTHLVATNPSPKCIFCGQLHFMTQCTTYPSVKDRTNRLSELNRCTRCTYIGHSQDSCKFQFKSCRFCELTNHHSALCFKNQPTSKLDSNVKPMVTCTVSLSSPEPENGKLCKKGKEKSQWSVQKSKTAKPQSCNIQPATCAEPLKSRSHMPSTVLPTATMEVINEGQSRGIERRAFFDQGSQRSFITAEIVDKLKLRVVDSVVLEVSPFRSPSRQETFDVVQPTLKLGNWKCAIQILVVDKLPISIHSPGIVSIANQLRKKGITLADKHLDTDIIDEVSLLLGADIYSHFITGLDHCGKVNLMSSPGGYLIYGPIVNSVVAKMSPHQVQHVTVNHASAHCIAERTLHMVDEKCEPVNKLWDLDTIEIKDSHESHADELTHHQKYLSSVRYDDDNFLSTTSDSRELVGTRLEANPELEKKDMPLQMWTTNSHDLQDRIEIDFTHEERSKDVSVLGLNWRVEKDTINIKPPPFKLIEILTKNRVSDVLRLSHSLKLMHGSTKRNPADLLPRGVKFKIFQGSTWWLHGPDWLVTSDLLEQTAPVTVNEIVAELHIDSAPEPLLDTSQYSSLPVLFGLTNQVAKAVKKWSPRFQWYGAVHYWIQYEQDRYSSKIWARLYSARNMAGHEESKNMIKALGIPLDNRGLIHSRGWLAYADIRFNTKYPVLMSFMSHLTKLLMLKAHDDALHGGVAETLTQLCRDLWILKGHQAADVDTFRRQLISDECV